MLPNMLKYRMEKHVTAPFYAAHGLDPLFFQKGTDEPNEAYDLKTEIGMLGIGCLPKEYQRFYELAVKRTDVLNDKREVVSVKVLDSVQRRVVWTQHLCGAYPLLAKCANRLLSMHASSAASERNWSV
eukprot:228192-Chlamydomonas_euryale.AAC.1